MTDTDALLPKLCPKCSGEETLYTSGLDSMFQVACVTCDAKGFAAATEEQAVALFLSAGPVDQDELIASTFASYFPYGTDDRERIVGAAAAKVLTQADQLGIVQARLNSADLEMMFEDALDAECAEWEAEGRELAANERAENAWIERGAL